MKREDKGSKRERETHNRIKETSYLIINHLWHLAHRLKGRRMNYNKDKRKKQIERETIK